MTTSRYPTSQKAWEDINLNLVIYAGSKEVWPDSFETGSQILIYDHFMEINKAWVDPNFDFGKMFGYKKQKWNSLVSNYVDLNLLDLAKSEVLEKEKKKAKNYNVVFKFSNTHNSGHGCLISLVFQRRYTQDNPIILINIRSSEVTKRLLMDFLLIQRIAEYIYGNESVSLKLYCGNMFLTAENFVMYNTYKPLEDVLKGQHSSMAKKVLKVLREFSKPEALNLKYKVHLRAAKRLNQVNTTSLLAKDCNIF